MAERSTARSIVEPRTGAGSHRMERSAAAPRAEVMLDRPGRSHGLMAIGDPGVRRRAALQLQASHGNAAVRSLLQRDPGPDPTPTGTPAVTGTSAPTGTTAPTTTPAPALTRPIAVDLRGSRAIAYSSAPGDIGSATVQVTGRLGLRGKAALPGPAPARKVSDWARTELATAVVNALAASTPGSAAPAAGPPVVTLSVGGQSLSIALSATASLNRGFHVLARVTGPAGKAAPSYAFGGTEFTGSVSIDAEVAFTPKTPGPAPTDPSIGEDYLAGVSFAGVDGKVAYGKGRSVAIAGDDAVAAIDHLPDKVKGDRLLDTPEKRRRFLAFMRPWFGSDAATLAHFAQIELVDVPTKGYVYLHRDAKARLEAVQAEVGADAMPRNSGVAWSFRNAFDFTGAQNHAGMHTLGYAVDYNAYANPMLKDSRLHQLIRTVTGRSHHLVLGEYSSRRRLIRKLGDATAGSDEAARQKLELSKEVTDFFTQLESEVNALAAASKSFQQSLGPLGTAKLVELKGKYLEALKLKDKAARADAIAAVATDLPAVLKPWFDLIAAREAEARTQAAALGVTDLAALGEAKDLAATFRRLDTAAKGIGRYKAKADRAKKAPRLSKWERKRLAGLATAVGSTFDPETAEDDLPAELDRLVSAAAAAVGPVSADLALYAQKPEAGKASVGDLKGLWNSLQQLRAALADPSFVFPAAAGKKGWKVSDPSASQLLDMGYFNLREPKGRAEAFDLVFMKSMVKHGFELGAAWGTPDPMHFELVVKAPTER